MSRVPMTLPPSHGLDHKKIPTQALHGDDWLGPEFKQNGYLFATDPSFFKETVPLYNHAKVDHPDLHPSGNPQVVHLFFVDHDHFPETYCVKITYSPLPRPVMD